MFWREETEGLKKYLYYYNDILGRANNVDALYHDDYYYTSPQNYMEKNLSEEEREYINNRLLSNSINSPQDAELLFNKIANKGIHGFYAIPEMANVLRIPAMKEYMDSHVQLDAYNEVGISTDAGNFLPLKFISKSLFDYYYPMFKEKIEKDFEEIKNLPLQLAIEVIDYDDRTRRYVLNYVYIDRAKQSPEVIIFIKGLKSGKLEENDIKNSNAFVSIKSQLDALLYCVLDFNYEDLTIENFQSALQFIIHILGAVKEYAVFYKYDSELPKEVFRHLYYFIPSGPMDEKKQMALSGWMNNLREVFTFLMVLTSVGNAASSLKLSSQDPTMDYNEERGQFLDRYNDAGVSDSGQFNSLEFKDYYKSPDIKGDTDTSGIHPFSENVEITHVTNLQLKSWRNNPYMGYEGHASDKIKALPNFTNIGSVLGKIIKFMYEGKNTAIAWKDVPYNTSATITQAFYQLMDAGIIERVSRGMYKITPLGEVLYENRTEDKIPLKEVTKYADVLTYTDHADFGNDEDGYATDQMDFIHSTDVDGASMRDGFWGESEWRWINPTDVYQSIENTNDFAAQPVLASVNNSLFIYLDVPESVSETYSHITKLEDDLHVTLLYLPNVRANDHAKERLLNEFSKIAKEYTSITCKTSGFATFNNPDQSFVALINAQNISKIHNQLYEAVHKAYGNVKRTYDYIPHMTLRSKGTGRSNMDQFKEAAWNCRSFFVRFGEAGVIYKISFGTGNVLEKINDKFSSETGSLGFDNFDTSYPYNPSPEEPLNQTPTVRHENQDIVKYRLDPADEEMIFEKGTHQQLDNKETNRPATPFASLKFAEYEESYADLDHTMRGSCMLVAERIAKLIKSLGIDAKVIEGYVEEDVSIYPVEHTWIEIEATGEKIDPTFTQFGYGALYIEDDPEYPQKEYTIDAYLALCEEYPADENKFRKKEGSSLKLENISTQIWL